MIGRWPILEILHSICSYTLLLAHQLALATQPLIALETRKAWIGVVEVILEMNARLLGRYFFTTFLARLTKQLYIAR